MFSLSKTLQSAVSHRAFATLSAFTPLRTAMALQRPSITNNITPVSRPSVLSMVLGLTQRRWKSRGHTFQPSTLKRKRRVGFLARLRSKDGRKILKNRQDKGRWYLTY